MATPPLRLIVILVAATAVGPFAMQIFLPALPAIQDSFGVHPATAQLIFSLSAFAIAVGTLIYGPVSDRLGRRPAMLAGMVIYLVGSVICALAPTISILIAGRLIQAAGGCAGMVLSRVVVRDRYDREQSATAIAYITMAMVAAPMIAPALGGIIADWFGWQSVFLAAAIFGSIVLAVIWRGLPETRGPQASGGRSGNILFNFRQLLQSRAFVGFALQGMFSLSVFFCFLSAAPYVMVKVFEREAGEYGLFFVLVSGGFMLGNLVAARITGRIGVERMVVLGSFGAVVGTATALLLAAAGIWSPWAIFLPSMLTGFSQGVALPNSMAAVVSVRPDIAGAASGLSGFVQMAGAAIAAQIIGSIQNGTPYPLLCGMLFFAIGSLAAALLATRATGVQAIGD